MGTSTERERIAALAFYAAAVLLVYLIYLLFRPFLVPLAWAGVLAICFYPAHRWFERRLSRGHAALLSTLSVALLVIVPMLAIASAFVSEAARVLDNVPELLAGMPGSARKWMDAGTRYIPGAESLDLAALLADPARRLAEFVSSQAAGVVHDVALFVVDLAIMLFALFFLFRDAAGVMDAARRGLPLPAEIRERLLQQTRTLVMASVISGLIVAAVQGLLGGLAFWALGLSAPVFWGVVMAIFCLLPFGAWVVWAPAALWLILTGSIGRGIALVAIGAGVVGLVDNFLRPFILSGHSEINGLLLFISLLGGVIAFGTVGLVLGPVLMSAAVALYDAFTIESTPPSSKPTA